MFSRLRKRTDGAIFVSGLVMGVLLVGALYHVVSVGDAILWREHLQNAADAAAFENAVWNARGMNIIVFINIVMSMVMAVLVAIRGLLMLMTAATVAFVAGAVATCALAWTGIGGLGCAFFTNASRVAERARNAVSRLDDRVTPVVHDILDGLSIAQSAVATATPALGVVKAHFETSNAYGMDAYGLSASLFPSGAHPTRRGPPVQRPPGAGGPRHAAPGSRRIPVIDGPVGGNLREDMPRIGVGVSLPVSLDGAWKLCEKAGEFVPNELFAAFGAITGSDSGGSEVWGSSIITDLLGGIAGSFPSVFCGEQNPLSINAVGDLFADTAANRCEGAAGQDRVTDDSPHSGTERDNLRDFQEFWEQRDGAYVFDLSRCQAREMQNLERQGRGYRQNDRGQKPARVWRYTANGDLFMQSWGLAFDAPRFLAADDRGLAFAAAGSGASLVDANVEDTGTAQAEMYFDAGPDSGCDGSWDNCVGEAMWLMRWKARLRRLHHPGEMAARSIARIAVAELVNVAHQGINALSRGYGSPPGRHAQGRSTSPDSLATRVTRFFIGHVWDSHLANRGSVGFGPWRYNFPVEGSLVQRLAGTPPSPSEIIIH
jgi:hypothetical protein